MIDSPGALVLLVEANAKLTIPPGDATLVVTKKEKVQVLRIEFMLGRYYAGATVLVQWTHNTVDFFDRDGTLIATHPMPAMGVKFVGNRLIRKDYIDRKKSENAGQDAQPSTRS